MSVPEVYITSAIKWDGAGGRIPAVIRTQLTQFTNLKITVPRKNYRSAELSTNLLNSELTALYGGSGFSTHANFLYIKWRGAVVFWGPIINKDVDYEASSLALQALDQGVRLEHHYFRIGDVAMDVPADPTKGHLPVSALGLELGLIAGETPNPSTSRYIPLGVRMGTDSHTELTPAPKPIEIERGQEIWRTMLELGDRSDGPLFEFVPLPIDDVDVDFARMDVYGPYFRNDVSSTVKFHYGTGLNNTRNMRFMVGGEVLTHAHVLTQNNEWRVTTASTSSGRKYGVWIQWEQADFNLSDDAVESDALAGLGAIGDAILDSYGRPLVSAEVTLRRDDQVHDAANQFYWLTDFKVGDVVEVHGIKGGEEYQGNYQIDEVRLEQESDNTGQVRQAIMLVPHVEVGDYTYAHGVDFVDYDDLGTD